MSGHVVVFFPDTTLNVVAVGPFRTPERAEQVRARLDVALEPEALSDQFTAHRLPQVVECLTEAEAVARFGIEAMHRG